MDKKSSNLRKQRLQQARFAPVLLSLVVAALFSWLAFRVFTGIDCEFFGSKLALVVVPTCTALGNQAAAVIPFLIASASLFFAIQSYREYRHLTNRSKSAASSGPLN